MARGGINKALVRDAREALIARGIRPSIDAVRVELGNTGSKSTILRYLKELSAPAASTAPVTLNDELAHLVASVAERVEDQARRAVSAEQTRVDDAWRRHAQAQAQQRELIDALQEQVRRLDSQLVEYRTREHQLQTRSNDLQGIYDARQQELVDLQQALSQRDLLVQSLNERCEHLKASLDHYREQQRAQREQDLERYDQQMQQLIKEQRTLQSTLLQKQEEIAQLNRDNERLITESRLAARQMLTDAQEYRQANAAWKQLAKNHQEAQVQWQAEQADLRSRLRAALIKQRGDAHSIRNEQRQIIYLQRLLEATASPSA
ncbi:DNA-binding protein [Pseudomonas umsongensis]|jgi:chromosome segregation ATPase|uniref:Cointegrate resolution protein T n=1 Tax=Pseudomonas umsongensis TaxID=198618 RepID=A0AAE7DG06_9PSED|nr:DNA-binding protein [Pseudomonas umsongensis]QJC80400.1 cointegrate resolution protein T [Pseudomonas umsongensis]